MLRAGGSHFDDLGSLRLTVRSCRFFRWRTRRDRSRERCPSSLSKEACREVAFETSAGCGVNAPNPRGNPHGIPSFQRMAVLARRARTSAACGRSPQANSSGSSKCAYSVGATAWIDRGDSPPDYYSLLDSAVADCEAISTRRPSSTLRGGALQPPVEDCAGFTCVDRFSMTWHEFAHRRCGQMSCQNEQERAHFGALSRQAIVVTTACGNPTSR